MLFCDSQGRYLPVQLQAGRAVSAPLTCTLISSAFSSQQSLPWAHPTTLWQQAYRRTCPDLPWRQGRHLAQPRKVPWQHALAAGHLAEYTQSGRSSSVGICLMAELQHGQAEASFYGLRDGPYASVAVQSRSTASTSIPQCLRTVVSRGNGEPRLAQARQPARQRCGHLAQQRVGRRRVEARYLGLHPWLPRSPAPAATSHKLST